MRKPFEFVAFPARLAALSAYGPYRGIVSYIVDGDTFDVHVDVGWNDYPYRTIRVHGIDTPELNTPEGKAARDYVRLLMPSGTPCVLKTYKDVQTFGRYVAEVTVQASDGNTFDLATYLITAGHAVRSVR